MGQLKTVTIIFDGKSISVDPSYAVDLSCTQGDRVFWRCAPSSRPFNFDIWFWHGKTPFADTHFHSEHCASGEIKYRTKHDEYFKYSIEVEGVLLDPGVIIKE